MHFFPFCITEVSYLLCVICAGEVLRSSYSSLSQCVFVCKIFLASLHTWNLLSMMSKGKLHTKSSQGAHDHLNLPLQHMYFVWRHHNRLFSAAGFFEIGLFNVFFPLSDLHLEQDLCTLPQACAICFTSSFQK